MPWQKADKELIKLLEQALLEYRCDRKMMFGSPTFFVNNNMFAGVHQDTVILRLSETDRSSIFSLYPDVTPFTPMPGRIMKEYAALPQAICDDEAVFHEWLEDSYNYAASLPPKEKKRRRK